MDYYEFLSKFIMHLLIILFWSLTVLWVIYLLSSVSLIKISLTFYEGVAFCFFKALSILVIPIVFYSFYLIIALNSYALYKIMNSLSSNKKFFVLSKNFLWIK